MVGSGDDSIVPGYALLAWAILPPKENRRGIQERLHLYFNLLSSEMDPAEIRLIRQSSLKRETQRFYKIHLSPLL